MERKNNEPNFKEEKQTFVMSFRDFFQAVLHADTKDSISDFLSRLNISVAGGRKKGFTRISGSKLERSFRFLSTRLAIEKSPEARANILLDTLKKCGLEENLLLEILREVKIE